jgi:hypothetical protein
MMKAQTTETKIKTNKGVGASIGRGVLTTSSADPFLTVICAWCHKTIKQGNSLAISHGICVACADKLIKEGK